MTFKKLEKVSSLRAVQNTIRYDTQVAFWFRQLLFRPELRASLETDPPAKVNYATASLFHGLETALFVCEACFLVAALIFDQVFAALVAIALAIAAHNAGDRKRAALSRIGSGLVRQELVADALPRTTLYQMCERLSRRYNVPSLIDTITYSDAVLRRAIVTADVLLILIWPVFALWKWFALLLATYHLLGVLSRTGWFAAWVRLREERHKRQRINKDH